MSRWLTVLFAAAEAVLVLVIGVGIPVVASTLVWGLQYGFGADWTVVWRAAADVWLLGHGVDVTFTLDPALAAALGLPGAELPVNATIALLGFALLTLLLAVRAGRRISEAAHPLLAALSSTIVFAGGTVAVVVLSLHPAARASIAQGVALPTLVFVAGLLIGMVGAALRAPLPGQPPTRFARAVRRVLDRIPLPARAGIDGALRAGLAASAGLVAAAAVLAALSIAIAFTKLIALYETLHADVLGGAVLTLAQFAVLPNAVIWVASWLVGPGFAVGAGSSVGPFGTALGPIPPVPLLGAIPPETVPLGWLGLLAPLAAGLVAGILAHRRIRAVLRDWWAVLVGVGGGVVGGLVVGLLAAWSGGAGGPGRLAVLGPDGAQVGVWAGVEFAASIVVGMLVDAQFAAAERRRLPLSR